MRWPRAVLVGAALCAAMAGCRGSRAGLVEAELRVREKELSCAKDELQRQRALNDALAREMAALRGDLPPNAHLTGQPLPVYPLRSVTLGRQTGGYDAGTGPYDSALQVVLEPRDADGHSVKVPGALLVHALEVTAEGQKKPLSAWQIPPDELARTWRSGLLSTGYVVVLPWKAWPTTDKLKVVAVFQLTDGRTFEAEKDVTIRLAPANRRPPPIQDVLPLPGVTPPPPPTPLPLPGETLPPPRKPEGVGPAISAKPNETAATTVGRPRASSAWLPEVPQIELGRPKSAELP